MCLACCDSFRAWFSICLSSGFQFVSPLMVFCIMFPSQPFFARMQRLLLFYYTTALILSLDNLNAIEAGGFNNSSMDQEEIHGLFDVMEAILDDPTWRSTHEHPCTDDPWPGIGCEASSDGLLHVTKLHIGMDSTGSCREDSLPRFSSSIFKLRGLKSLFIFNCFQISNAAIPPEIVRLSPSLEEVVFKSNSALLGSIPRELAGLTKLKVLSLSQNGLNGNIPPEFGKLDKLQHLDLSYNKLTGTIPDEFGGLKSLSILDLSENKLQGALPPSIGSLLLLQKIDLSSNNLSGRVPPELGKLQNLCLLALSRNQFTGPLPDTLKSLRNLQYLMVESNPMNSALPNFLGSLPRLSELSLSSAGFEGSIPKSLCSLSNLSALALDDNKLNGSIPSDLGELQYLFQMNLSNNFLSGEIPFSADFVKRLGNKLDLSGNKDLCASKILSQAFTAAAIRHCSDKEHGKGSVASKAGGFDFPRQQLADSGLAGTVSVQGLRGFVWIILSAYVYIMT